MMHSDNVFISSEWDTKYHKFHSRHVTAGYLLTILWLPNSKCCTRKILSINVFHHSDNAYILNRDRKDWEYLTKNNLIPWFTVAENGYITIKKGANLPVPLFLLLKVNGIRHEGKCKEFKKLGKCRKTLLKLAEGYLRWGRPDWWEEEGFGRMYSE
jgi:hypothetical protein